MLTVLYTSWYLCFVSEVRFL